MERKLTGGDELASRSRRASPSRLLRRSESGARVALDEDTASSSPPSSDSNEGSGPAASEEEVRFVKKLRSKMELLLFLLAPPAARSPTSSHSAPELVSPEASPSALMAATRLAETRAAEDDVG